MVGEFVEAAEQVMDDRRHGDLLLGFGEHMDLSHPLVLYLTRISERSWSEQSSIGRRCSEKDARCQKARKRRY